MAITQVVTQEFETINCSECGTTFAIPVHFYKELHSSKRTWTCPNGHQRVFLAESVEAQLKKELATEKQRREMAEREVAMEKKRVEYAENVTKRLRKRIANGMCPCCKRSFQNLRRHMATKHPNENQ